MQPIAHIHTDFPTKFGVPRQSGLVDRLTSAIVFEPEFRNPDYLRGIEGWSHLWLIWQFHRVAPDDYSPTVLPPKLGGKTRVGVFATRSPFRPNHMGLSVVRLASVDWTAKGGPVLYVTGADMVDGTPIFDIKPYVPYADSVPDAVDAFAETRQAAPLAVIFPEPWRGMIAPEKLEGLTQALSLNPRPGYQHDAARVYGMEFGGFDVRFTVEDGVLRAVHWAYTETAETIYGTGDENARMAYLALAAAQKGTSLFNIRNVVKQIGSNSWAGDADYSAAWKNVEMRYDARIEGEYYYSEGFFLSVQDGQPITVTLTFDARLAE